MKKIFNFISSSKAGLQKEIDALKKEKENNLKEIEKLKTEKGSNLEKIEELKKETPYLEKYEALKNTKKQEWEIKAYEEGSAACRNYSNLTMRTRTLSQHIMLISVGVFAGIYSEAIPINNDIGPKLLIVGGSILCFFSISLRLIDWHYQSAFSAIRDSLAALECKNQILKNTDNLNSPWRSHLAVRTRFHDHIASYFPFLLLMAVGGSALYFGANELVEGNCLIYIVIVGIVATIITFFFRLAYIATKKDNHTKDQIKLLENKNELDE